MKAVLFFLYMSFFLLSGNSSMHAGIRPERDGSALRVLTGTNLAHLSTIRHESFLVNGTAAGTEAEYFVTDDAEDEDVNNFSAQKYKLMARSHATHAYPSYPSILNYLCNCFKAPPAFFAPPAHKYILQGVLRI